MDVISILLIAVGLAMDAFAVSIVSGIPMKTRNTGYAVIYGLFFGGFQFIMPCIGWFLGGYFADFLNKYAHWVAFFLLAVIGGKMIVESLKNNDDGEGDDSRVINLHNLIILSIATSIDALAVGISFAVLDTYIWSAAAIIGFVAFIFSFFGVKLGRYLGGLVGKKMETIGGIILIGIGLKILLERF